MSSIFFIIHQCPRKWETLFNKMIRNYFVNFCFYYNLIKNVLNLIFTASVLRIPRIQQFQVHQTFGNKCALSQAQIVYGGTHVSCLVMPNSLRPQGVQPTRQVPLSMEFYREEQKSLVYLETQRIRTFFFFNQCYLGIIWFILVVSQQFLPCSWNSPGENTGIDSHSLLQGIIFDSGIESGSIALQEDSLPSETPGKPNCGPARIKLKLFMNRLRKLLLLNSELISGLQLY